MQRVVVVWLNIPPLDSAISNLERVISLRTSQNTAGFEMLSAYFFLNVSIDGALLSVPFCGRFLYKTTVFGASNILNSHG